MSVVSCNLFGLRLLSTGFTMIELRDMLKLKLVAIVLENIPQIAFQLLYVFALGEVTEGVMFAFVASVLSVISTLLSYFIQRDTSDIRYVHYFLECERNAGVTATLKSPTTATTVQALESMSPATPSGDVLSKAERKKIDKNQGRTQALSVKLCMLFRVDPKRIEVGKTTLGQRGALTHIVHALHQSEIDEYDAGCRHGAEAGAEDNQDSNISPSEFAWLMYSREGVMERVNAIFREHFELDSSFSVRFVSADQKRKDTMSMHQFHIQSNDSIRANRPRQMFELTLEGFVNSNPDAHTAWHEFNDMLQASKPPTHDAHVEEMIMRDIVEMAQIVSDREDLMVEQLDTDDDES